MSTFDVSELFRPSRRRRLARFPQLIARAVALLWRAAPREFATSVGLQILSGIGLGVQLMVGRRLLADLSDPETMFRAVIPALAVLAATTALVSFADVCRGEQQRLLSELVGHYATDRVLETATSAPLVAFDDVTFHDRLERARINAVIRPVSVANGVIGLASAGCAVVGITAALWTLEPVFLAMVLVAYIPSWVVGIRGSRAAHEYAVDQTERDRRRSYILATLTGREQAQEVRAFNLGPHLRGRHDLLYRDRITGFRRLVRRRVRLGLVGSCSASTLLGVTLSALLWLVTSDRVSLAVAGAAAAGIVLLGQRLQALARAGAAVYESALFLDDVTSFLDAPSESDAEELSTRPPTAFSQLELDDVWFSYPSADTPALRGVSLQVRAGEVVALVGRNGSGKSTLAKVIASLHRPSSGQVLWDGIDTATYEPAALRRLIAVIFQDFVRYQFSVAENIAVGNHERAETWELVRAAAARVGLDDTIADLPQGYDTMLGPHYFGGHDLSLGQWQRIALARALFRDAPFVILDEPTAAVDPEAEARLFADVKALCDNRSVLLITHRLASVRHADRIYVLDDGRIIEHGSHDQLIARAGQYAELFRMQSSRYRDRQPEAVLHGIGRK